MGSNDGDGRFCQKWNRDEEFVTNEISREEPAKSTCDVEITGETEAQKRNRDIRNQEKRVTWENNVIKSREKGVLRKNIQCDDTDTKIRSYLMLCLGSQTKKRRGSQQENEEEYSFTAEGNNDPVTYAEFMSTKGWEDVSRDNLPCWQFQKHLKLKSETQ